MNDYARQAPAIETLRRLAEHSMTTDRTAPSWGMIPAGIVLGIIDSLKGPAL